MANTAAFFGFAEWGTVNSSAPNFGQSHNPPYRISSSYNTAIGFGDPVKMNTSATGYVERWVAGDGATTPCAGVFVGCSYYSTSQKKTVWSNYWPGSDATGDVNAFLVDAPNAIFKVQAATGPITQTSIGRTADVTMGTVNTTTGISGASLTNPGTTATFPFKVVGIVNTPPGGNGTDTASANNYVLVTFNNEALKTTTSAP